MEEEIGGEAIALLNTTVNRVPYRMHFLMWGDDKNRSAVLTHYNVIP